MNDFPEPRDEWSFVLDWIKLVIVIFSKSAKRWEKAHQIWVMLMLKSQTDKQSQQQQIKRRKKKEKNPV